MKVSEIRQAKSVDDLRPAIKFLYDNICNIPIDQVMAMRCTIDEQIKTLGLTMAHFYILVNKYYEEKHDA